MRVKTAVLLGLVLALGMAGTAMSADLADSEWRPNFVSTSELPAGALMLVHFDPDGKISGTGGCNQFFGSYVVSGNAIKIGPLVSTRKGCPGLLLAETAFFATLEAAKSFTQEGDSLILYDAAGIRLAQFDRAS